MAKEQDKKATTSEKTENNGTSANQPYGLTMAEKLLKALGTTLPSAWRNMPDENAEKAEKRSIFPWDNWNKPGGII